MREWLRTRGRSILSFLSDLGGALALVVLAVGLIAGAITGAILLALTAFPQPFFTMLVVGVALLAAGLTVHFLRGPLSPPEPVMPTPTPVAAAPNPYQQATALQRAHDDKKKSEDEQRERDRREDEEKRRVRRRAARKIAEELRDRVALLDAPNDRYWTTAPQKSEWNAEHPVLLDYPDPAPYQAAREAHRCLDALFELRSFVDEWGNANFNNSSAEPRGAQKLIAMNKTSEAINALEVIEDQA